jgi:hypothetical protein
LAEAVLSAGPGAAIDGQTALAFRGVRDTVIDPIQVARPRDRSDRSGRGLQHEPTLLPPHHIKVLDGIPHVVPPRAIFNMAGSQRYGAHLRWWVQRMERVVNNALTAQVVTGASLHAMLEEVAQRGRPGIRVMRQILSKIGPDYIAPASGLETRVVQLCERVGLPPLRRQVNLGDEHGWIGRVDFVDEHLPYVLEVQSEEFHMSPLDQALDRVRIARLEAAGNIVDQVVDVDVWHRPDVVIGTILEGTRRAALLKVRTSRAPAA